MIFHRLVFRYLFHKDDEGFYLLQARDTVRWLQSYGVVLGAGTSVLDLGCGHGLIGGLLHDAGCDVTFADEENQLVDRYRGVDFRKMDVNTDGLCRLGQYDLVICSNVLEHIPSSEKLIGQIDQILRPGGRLYLSWTNWLSPWGGQDYSPFHYLGARLGHRAFDRLIGRPRVHTPYETLFPTYIGRVLTAIRANAGLRIVTVLPRYYPELWFITRIPVVREFATWNCLVFIEKLPENGDGSRNETVLESRTARCG